MNINEMTLHKLIAENKELKKEVEMLESIISAMGISEGLGFEAD